jgi:hypothetical protein
MNPSTISTLQSFPGRNSIPPATFYTIQGLAPWLNQNPSYKYFFVNYPKQFPGLSSMNSTLSSIGYDAQYVPLASQVITLSYNQLQEYKQQLQLFQHVYAFNSNAYINSLTSSPPIYYSFNSYQELMTYKSSVALVNKLYPFNAMAYGTTDQGQTLGWIIPFPL